MKLLMFLPFHIRITHVKVVGWDLKQPSNIDLWSPCWLTSYSWPFTLLCNFQLSIAPVMRHSSVRRHVLELLGSYKSFKTAWSFLLYTAGLARQGNLPPPWFGIGVFLLLQSTAVLFFHYLAPVKQDFKLSHQFYVLKLLFWTPGPLVVWFLLSPLAESENSSIFYQRVWLSLL